MLYPERSITPHACGRGRLFPGFELETRRAVIDMIGLAVVNSVTSKGQDY